MSKPRIIISGIGNHGDNILSRLSDQGLLNAEFLSYSELIQDNLQNIYLLFIIYNPKDSSMKEVNEIIGLHTNQMIIELIIDDRIERKNPHYVINNFSIDAAAKEISTLIKAFNDLGRFPSQASIDMADIIDSLKNVGRLQMKEFTIKTNDEHNFLGQLSLFLSTAKNIKTVWFQFYFQKEDDLLYTVLENLFDAVSSNLSSETKVLWNVNYVDKNLNNERDRCILLFC